MTPERKMRIRTFLQGSGKTAVLIILTVILTAVLTSFGRTFITIPMPGDYAEKAALCALADAHKVDYEKLDNKKMNKDDYEKRHEELKQHFAKDIKESKEMIRELYFHLLGKSFKSKDKSE